MSKKQCEAWKLCGDQELPGNQGPSNTAISTAQINEKTKNLQHKSCFFN